jgi:pimeloyl-ACP methyl ester carboxylesterase
MCDRLLRTQGGCRRLVLFDKPSIGSSDPVDRDRDFHDQMAEAYLAVLDAVDADAAWFVGSLLAAIARTIQAHPARVLGAALINPPSPDQFGQSDAQGHRAALAALHR